MIPAASSVFSRSARMLEEMPSSDLVSSSRKCRRLPNIMSRIISKLHLSPTTSSVRLIGQPERWSSVMDVISQKTACNIALVVSEYTQLQIASGRREPCNGQSDFVEPDDAGRFC